MEDIFLKLSNQLRSKKKPKYLFSHLALKEGLLENDRTSPNAMSVERLYPDLYHRVCLGVSSMTGLGYQGTITT